MLGGIVVVILLLYPSASGSLILRTGAGLCGERGVGGPFPENRHWRTDGGQGISEVRAERQGRAHASLDTKGI